MSSSGFCMHTWARSSQTHAHRHTDTDTHTSHVQNELLKKDLNWMNECLNTHSTRYKMCCMQETYFTSTETHNLKVKGWK